MTLQNLEIELKTVCPDTYELSAPPGLTRYIVYQQYGSELVCGDDTGLTDCPKVQIDLLWQRKGDSIVADVLELMRKLNQSFTVVEIFYDDEYASMRCIMELVLV